MQNKLFIYVIQNIYRIIPKLNILNDESCEKYFIHQKTYPKAKTSLLSVNGNGSRSADKTFINSGDKYDNQYSGTINVCVLKNNLSEVGSQSLKEKNLSDRR